MAAEPIRHGFGRRVRHAPWSAEQAARLIVSNLAALAGILATAYGAASADDTPTALVWLNLSLAALAFAGVSNALWLVRVHNATSTWRADVLDEVATTIRVPGTVEVTSEGYVVVPGLERYHRPGCAFVAGRATRAAEPADAATSDLVPCEVCIRE
jgi:hypothetical protein